MMVVECFETRKKPGSRNRFVWFIPRRVVFTPSGESMHLKVSSGWRDLYLLGGQMQPDFDVVPSLIVMEPMTAFSRSQNLHSSLPSLSEYFEISQAVHSS